MEYQLNYSSRRPQMYDKKERIKRAKRIIITLKYFLKRKSLKQLLALDVGASTGIIDNYLAAYFKEIIGTDIDKEGIIFAQNNYKRPNLVFKEADALNLPFRDNSFDVVICTHVYEHVPDPKKLFEEINRVLKPGGICYFAAMNSLWPIEPHYNLPFLALLPKRLGNFYVRIFGKASSYYETPKNYWQLKGLVRKFAISDLTGKILRDPVRFGYENSISEIFRPLVFALSPLAIFFAPTFFWLLEKDHE